MKAYYESMPSTSQTKIINQQLMALASRCKQPIFPPKASRPPFEFIQLAGSDEDDYETQQAYLNRLIIQTQLETQRQLTCSINNHFLAQRKAQLRQLIDKAKTAHLFKTEINARSNAENKLMDKTYKNLVRRTPFLLLSSNTINHIQRPLTKDTCEEDTLKVRQQTQKLTQQFYSKQQIRKQDKQLCQKKQIGVQTSQIMVLGGQLAWNRNPQGSLEVQSLINTARNPLKNIQRQHTLQFEPLIKKSLIVPSKNVYDKKDSYLHRPTRQDEEKNLLQQLANIQRTKAHYDMLKKQLSRKIHKQKDKRKNQKGSLQKVDIENKQIIDTEDSLLAKQRKNLQEVKNKLTEMMDKYWQDRMLFTRNTAN